MSNVQNFSSSSGGASPITTITGNTGGPVGPTAGNVNIVGTGAVAVTGNPGTSTETISVLGTGLVWTDHPISATVTADTGSFFTADAVQLTLPTTPAQGTVCKFFVDFASITCQVKAGGAGTIRSTNGLNQATITANVAASAANTRGTSIELTYRTVGDQWCVNSVNGTWI